MKLLVHACCGPCSIMPTRLLAAQGHDITVLYANSNIAPQSEYEKRLVELKKYAAAQGFEVAEAPYRPDEWERVVAPIGESIKEFSPAFGMAAAKHVGAGAAGAGGAGGASGAGGAGDANETGASANADDVSEVGAAGAAGTTAETVLHANSVADLLDDERRRERCRACYRMRLEEAAEAAARGGFDALTTTLAVSPYQFTDVIREELDRAAAQAGVTAHFEDWRPYYDDATRISRELGMYRQGYCGCRFSITEAQATRAFIKQQRAEQKAAKAAERAKDESAERARKAEKQAYADAQAKKRAILKELRAKRKRDTNPG